MFDGKQIRDEILKDLANQVAAADRQPTMAVFLVGDNPVCEKYVELKKKLAEKTGIQFCLYRFTEKDSEEEIIGAIKYLNDDPDTDGIMIQIPIDDKFDRDKLINAISPDKDIDGLRYCLGLDSKYRPPVVEAIIEALRASRIMNQESEIKGKVTILGRGFLVGKPLERALTKNKIELTILDNNSWREKNIHNSLFIIQNSDIIISATGKAGIIKPDMVREGVILIDAGTAEENGELKGDIDPEAYSKASYYTPVPGGIGPVTVAMLFRNLIEK